MLSLTTPLKTRLQALPALAGWDVRMGTEHADRSAFPAADVRCVGAGVADSKSGAVMVAPQWVVTLVVRRGAVSIGSIEEAMSAVIESLHGWMPGRHGGRGWEPFALAQITEPMLPDEGLLGYQLTFNTAARYMGQQ